MRKTDREVAKKVILELFLSHNPPTNAQAALEISYRLGSTITAKDVSHLRGLLGLGWYPGRIPTKRQHEEARLLARFLAQSGVRNTYLETLHAGKTPDTQTGDYADVFVITPGRMFPWPELSRISDTEMRTLMLNVEENLVRQLIPLLTMVRQGNMDWLLDKLREDFQDGVTWDRPVGL